MASPDQIQKLEPDSPFRNDSNQQLLKALFFEFSLDPQYVLYTLRHHDHKGYPSLHRLYMEENDPTEYNFAVKYFESWEHWQRICECAFFKPYIAKWREELEIREKAIALSRIRNTAATTNKDAFAANKYLLDAGWKKVAPARGRPSKQAISEAADKIAADQASVNEDYERILGSVN